MFPVAPDLPAPSLLPHACVLFLALVFQDVQLHANHASNRAVRMRVLNSISGRNERFCSQMQQRMFLCRNISLAAF